MFESEWRLREPKRRHHQGRQQQGARVDQQATALHCFRRYSFRHHRDRDTTEGMSYFKFLYSISPQCWRTPFWWVSPPPKYIYSQKHANILANRPTAPIPLCTRHSISRTPSSILSMLLSLHLYPHVTLPVCARVSVLRFRTPTTM